jgi:hypothetical protein
MKRVFFLLLVTASSTAFAQDLAFGQKMVDTLTSPYFWGRGYTNDGMSRAADFLQSQFKFYGLEPMNGKLYFQEFSYPVNTFPGKMQARVNGKELIPGKDFIVGPESKTIKAEGSGFKRGKEKDSLLFYNAEEGFLIELADKLTMDLSPQVAEYGKITVDRKSIDGLPKDFKVNIENKFLKNFKTRLFYFYHRTL